MYKKIRGIYEIRHESNKTYVGSSITIKSRWSQHKCELRSNKHHSLKLQRAWNKYGEESFTFSILEIIDESIDLIEKEQEYIDKFNSFKKGFNCTPFAGNVIERPVSKKTRKKMAISRSKRVITEITRQRMSIAQSNRKGEKRSAQACKNIGEKTKGRKFSEESKLKMSLARKGKPHSAEHREKIAIKNRLRASNPISEETRKRMSESAKKRVVNSPRNELGDFIKYAFASERGVMFEVAA